jgi:hypothetical protein
MHISISSPTEIVIFVAIVVAVVIAIWYIICRICASLLKDFDWWLCDNLPASLWGTSPRRWWHEVYLRKSEFHPSLDFDLDICDHERKYNSKGDEVYRMHRIQRLQLAHDRDHNTPPTKTMFSELSVTTKPVTSDVADSVEQRLYPGGVEREIRMRNAMHENDHDPEHP